MKAILIFTAALMTGASIYGVASYKQLSDTKDFKELYVEKKQPLKEEPVSKKVITEKKAPVLTETKKVTKKAPTVKKIKRKQNLPAKEEVKTELVTMEELPAEELSIQEFFKEESFKEVKEEAAPTTTEQPKKVKKLKRNMFSRAALRD
jgi:hypothetical protein